MARLRPRNRDVGGGEGLLKIRLLWSWLGGRATPGPGVSESAGEQQSEGECQGQIDRHPDSVTPKHRRGLSSRSTWCGGWPEGDGLGRQEACWPPQRCMTPRAPNL